MSSEAVGSDLVVWAAEVLPEARDQITNERHVSSLILKLSFVPSIFDKLAGVPNVLRERRASFGVHG